MLVLAPEVPYMYGGVSGPGRGAELQAKNCDLLAALNLAGA
jgi:hypothetical protein